MARQPRAAQGFGLPQITPSPPGLVVIGRRADMGSLRGRERQTLEDERRVRLRSWDWLIEQVVGSGRRGTYGPLDWDDDFDFI